MRSALVSIIIPASNFVLLLTVGLSLTLADFARVRGQGALVAAGLFAPTIVLPPLALALTMWLQPGPAITASILLVAACPIGGIANAYALLARASPALSVTLTGLSCLAGVVTIPLLSKAYELALDQSLGFSAPLQLLVAQFVVVLGLPVALGMWLRHRIPDLLERWGGVLRRIAFISTAAVLLLVIATAPGAFFQDMATTVPLAAAFVAGSTIAGWIVASGLTSDDKDRFTIAAEFGARNVGVATTIAVTFLGRVEFAQFAAVYAIVEVPLLLLAVAWFRRRTKDGPRTKNQEPSTN